MGEILVALMIGGCLTFAGILMVVHSKKEENREVHNREGGNQV